jgi:hypothetical protein
MVIVPGTFIASAPAGILAGSLDLQTRHLDIVATVEAFLKCRGLG